MTRLTIALSMLMMLVWACSGRNAPEPVTEPIGDEGVMSAETTAPEEPSAEIPVGHEVGNLAPPIELVNQDGETVSLADYAGKTVALVFYRGHW